MRKNIFGVILGATLMAAATSVFAATVIVIHAIDAKGVGRRLGTVTANDSGAGLVLLVQLAGLPPGEHGFHVHENGDCGAKERDGKMTAGLAAGGHYDPQKSGKHEGPKGAGHQGDLPVLTADRDEIVSITVVAPRLKVADLKGRALVVHEGGDNYSDQPKPLGGGGNRIACGAIK